jgi:hypothetical protein
MRFVGQMGDSFVKVPIEEIGVDTKDGLYVRPSDAHDFTFVWRDASGVRWSSELRALVAYEPARWDHVSLLRQIVAAVKSEYGCTLHLVPDTRWCGMAFEIQSQLRSAA